MKVLHRLFGKSKKKDLSAAAESIAKLEITLREKEAVAAAIRGSLVECYEDAALGAKDANKIRALRADLDDATLEIDGMKSVINRAKAEALSVAESEIADLAVAKAKLREQHRIEMADEGGKLIAALQGLFVSIHRMYGVRSVISKDGFYINIPALSTHGAIDRANRELDGMYDETAFGPHHTAAQLSGIEAQEAKADPRKALEYALATARAAMTEKHEEAA